MKVCLPALFVGGLLVLTSCGPQTPLEENFQAISLRQDQIGVMRCSFKTHDQHLGDLRKKGWRVSGESRLESETRLSELELKKSAARKGAKAVLISESSIEVVAPASTTTSRLLSPPQARASSTATTLRGPDAILSPGPQSRRGNSSIRRERTAALPQQEVYRVETQLTTSSSKPSKKQTKFHYRVSFLSYR